MIGISAIIAWLVIPRKQKKSNDVESEGQKFRRIDFAGAILLAATIASFLLAIELGGQELPWVSPNILGLFGGGVVCGALFVVVEPVFPLQLLRHKDVICAYLMLLLQTAAQISVSINLRKT